MAGNQAMIQQQILANNSDLNSYLEGLVKWEDEVKNGDNNERDSSQKSPVELPPIRTRNLKQKPTPASRIGSYDYSGWDKFDVEGACKAVEYDDGKSDSDSEDANDEENQRLQKAAMEKEKGNNYFKKGQYIKAVECYSNGLLLDHENAILYANRAMALLKLERYAAAEEDCSFALEIDPTYVKALARRATARQKLNHIAKALQDYKLIIELQPGNKLAEQEIDKIKKMLKQESDGNIHRRHKTPLTRIAIEEVLTAGIRKKDMYPVVKQTREGKKGDSAFERDDGVTMKLDRGKKDHSVPSNAFDFEKDYRTVKDDDKQLFELIKEIPVSLYSRLMSHSIDDILPRILRCFRTHYVREKLSYAEGLHALANIPRFAMALMFLDITAREDIQFLVARLRSYETLAPSDVDLDQLETSYKLKH